MKRFKLKNLKNGLRFQVEGSVLPSRQPEWGQSAGTKLKSQCDAWELANGSFAGNDPETDEQLWSFPDALELVEEDITAELVSEETKKAQYETILQKLRDLRKSDLSDVGKCADAILDIAKVLRRTLKGD